MERGEIWLASLDPASGHEQRGQRPVLVISPGASNRLTGVPVILPITSKGNFARIAGFAVSLDGAGTKTGGVVRCDQPTAIDLKAAGDGSWRTLLDTSSKKCWPVSLRCSSS